MRNKKIWGSAALVVVALLVWGLARRGEGAETTYRFVTVSRGDVESVVTATGTLQATETVEVGTQVSGQIAQILVDFNDRVKAGQLLARIDPTLLQQEVRSAEASLARSGAELEQATRELKRSEDLHAKQVVTDSEHDQARYAYDVARAANASAEISLERARRNLQYTEIRAPNDGVVVARNVDVGQTVAASLSAPTLFVLARDLGEMEILASVDESDIGKIRQGQDARFTVQAYPERPFTGTVRQVRLQSTTQENVVSYSVVIAVGNADGALLPGMTATVEFVVDRADDVLTVPNTALRFRPTQEMQEEIAARRPTRPAGDSTQARRAFPGAAPGGTGGSSVRPAAVESGDVSGAPSGLQGGGPTEPAAAGADASDRAVLWYVDAEGKLAIAPVRTGLSDGQSTVIESPSDVVQEGLQVIAAVTSGDAAETTATNPFQSGSSDRRMGPPGPPGGF